MSSPESDSLVISREEEEEQLYEMIYDMIPSYSKEETEEVDVPSSSDLTPAQLQIDDEMSAPAQGQKKQEDADTKGLDVDSSSSTQGIPVLSVVTKEKPWRKIGANTSDYFNYGFDEASWNTYCKRQSKLRTANRKLYTKIRAQRGHTRREEKGSCSAYPFSGMSSTPSPRQPPPDVAGGQLGSSGRMERPRCLSDKGNNTQVVTEMSPEEDRNTSSHLRPSSNIQSLFSCTPPLSVRHRSRSPLSPTAPLDRQHIDDPSTSPCSPCSSGVSSSVPKRTVSRAGASAAKAWEYCIWEEKYGTDRNRFREHRDGKRGRNKGREIYSSSHNSGEERKRHRDTAARGHKHHSSERFSGEKEEWQRMWRHRGKSEGWRKSSCSSSSSSSRSSRKRRDGGEDRDRQNRHSHKKAKRNKDKENALH